MTGVNTGGIDAASRVPDELRLLQEATNAVADAANVVDALARLGTLVMERTGWSEASTWLPGHDGPVPGAVALARRDGAVVRADGAIAVPVLAVDQVVAVLHFAVGDHGGVHADEHSDDALVEVVSLVAAQLGAQVRRRQLEDRVAEVQRELARANQELRAANDELRRSNADLVEFAYVASHDLSEPLRVISGHVQLLARRYEGKLDADADRYIGFAVDGCARLQALITDLLEYSRVGQSPLNAAPVDCNEIASDALANLAASVGADIEVGDLPVVFGDAGQLRQLFTNLVANALKFTTDEAPVVRVTATVDGDVARFEVADCGIGVPERHRDRIFRMFQRLHGRDEFAGTGMGLAICRRIIERHHGSIEVVDTPGGGATFAFTLPLTSRSSA